MRNVDYCRGRAWIIQVLRVKSALFSITEAILLCHESARSQENARWWGTMFHTPITRHDAVSCQIYIPADSGWRAKAVG